MKGRNYLWTLSILMLLASTFMVNFPVEALPVHDVAVTAISAPPETATGNSVTINVNASNLGSAAETFNLTVYYDGDFIDRKEVSLESGMNQTVSFSWWTLNVAPGSYTINATAILETDENPGNNWKTTTILIQTQQVTISIDPYITTGVAPGSAVAVNVTINTNVKIVGFRLWVKINSSVLSPGFYWPAPFNMWVFVTPGTFLSDWVTDYPWPPGLAPILYTTETDGYSDIAHYIKTWEQLPEGEGPSGNGTLCTLWFTSQSETDYSSIDITQAQYGTTYELSPAHIIEDGHYNEPAGGDVAVTSVVPAATEAYPTWSVPLDINVTVENVGAAPATFTVSAYYENVTAAYAIGTLPVTDLASGATENLTFSWDLDLSGVDLGLYTVKANATLEGDINLANNEFVDGTVKVKMPGDTDGDGDVDLDDVFVLAAAYLAIYPDPRYNQAADFDGDLDVDLDDVFHLAANYLKSTDKY